jgi:hypothetical protein
MRVLASGEPGLRVPFGKQPFAAETAYSLCAESNEFGCDPKDNQHASRAMRMNVGTNGEYEGHRFRATKAVG